MAHPVQLDHDQDQATSQAHVRIKLMEAYCLSVLLLVTVYIREPRLEKCQVQYAQKWPFSKTLPPLTCQCQCLRRHTMALRQEFRMSNQAWVRRCQPRALTFETSKTCPKMPVAGENGVTVSVDASVHSEHVNSTSGSFPQCSVLTDGCYQVALPVGVHA